MAQTTTGLHAVLSATPIYKLVQNTFGGSSARIRLVEEYFECDRVKSVLDIGCGPANILEFLPENIKYTGFDASANYIEHAKQRYRHRDAQFYARRLSQSEALELERYDLVLAMGILHHLDDHEALKLFKLAKTCLNDKGKLFTIDPCFVEKQRFLARFLIKQDRGQNVRRLEAYKNLAGGVFNKVSLTHCNNLSRLPYDHAIMLCRK